MRDLPIPDDMTLSDSKRLEVIHQLVADMHKVLHGNGRPGLVERVTRLETKVAIAGVVGGSLAGVLVSLISAAL